MFTKIPRQTILKNGYVTKKNSLIIAMKLK